MKFYENKARPFSEKSVLTVIRRELCHHYPAMHLIGCTLKRGSVSAFEGP